MLGLIGALLTSGWYMFLAGMIVFALMQLERMSREHRSREVPPQTTADLSGTSDPTPMPEPVPLEYFAPTPAPAMEAAPTPDSSEVTTAVRSLVQLGYRLTDARAIVQRVVTENPDLEAEGILLAAVASGMGGGTHGTRD